MHWVGTLIAGMAAVHILAILISEEARAIVRTGAAPNILSWAGLMCMGCSLVLTPAVPLGVMGALSLALFMLGGIVQFRRRSRFR